MNISFFLTPKCETVYLYEDETVRQGLKKMRSSGYTGIPVLTRENHYVGTITEGDFLWYIMGKSHGGQQGEGTEPSGTQNGRIQDTEYLRIADIPYHRGYRSVRIGTSMEELLCRVRNQNFVPVVDDRDFFIGIVTRKDIINYYTEHERVENRAVNLIDGSGKVS